MNISPIACPVCWPAYAGLLSSLGLGFLISTTYLLPLTAIFLIFALGTLAFRATSCGRYGPFLLSLVAATGILLEKLSLGIQSNDLQRNRSPGWCFLVECVAPARNFQRDDASFRLAENKLSKLNSKSV